ncbi:hypothetical protein PF002_g12074 [Phytophthora fragariae]|uniref:Helicase-associated domain-containing protein n=1 Tax=Phytophthora fragariae TaxID=53985 RepID=A0A6A3ZEK8_9STRA|nr:hypothetical protein PF002_g12074 [Phytophthora fragariae]
MLRLVSISSARLRVGVFRAAVAGATRFGVDREHAPTQHRYKALRFSSSDTPHNSRRWTTPALNDSEAWQQAVKPAFLTFLKLQKHLMVPLKFTVPHGDKTWPEAAWGYPLGKHATWLRKQWREGGGCIDPTQLQELEDMGFAWDRSQYKWDRFVLPALRRFYDLNGHTDWIRSEGCYSTQVSRDQARLEKLGFAWDFYEAEWSERILPALEAFHKVHGHCRVVVSFVVPSEATWPKQAHDLKLGTTVRTIRKNASYFDRIARAMDSLEAIEFDSKIAVSKWEERVEPILATFKQLHGHRNVPRDFVVPSNALWQQKDWGIQLGKLEPR